MSNVFGITARAYRFYADDGSESASSALAAENTAPDIAETGVFVLRYGVQESGQGSANGATTDDYQLQVAKNGGAFQNVTGASTIVQARASSNLTDAGATTQRLSAGSGSFIAGEIDEADGVVTDWQLTANNHSELLYSCQILDADVAPGDTLTFRVLRNGSVFNTYTETPTITVVGSTQDLAGAVFTKAPTFPQGAVDATYDLAGVVFTKAPTFPTGVIAQPVTTLENSAEGGSDGTTVTTGNSGGASGTAWDTVNISGTNTLVYQDAPVGADALVYELAAVSASQVFLEWDIATRFGVAQDELWTRFYRRTPASPAGNHVVYRVRAPSTLNHLIRFRINGTSDKFEIFDATNTLRWTSTMTEPIDAWYRVEVYWSKTTAQVKIWSDPDDTGTPTEDSGTLSFDFGSVNAEDGAFVSYGGNAFTTTIYGTDYLDNIGITSATWLGPLGTFGTGDQDLAGVTFQKAPTFPQGAVLSVYDLAGATFTRAPTFPQGSITSTAALVGVTFQKAPTFPQGAVTAGAVDLAGVTFTRAPTFPQGAVAPGVVNLAGTTFQRAPTFPIGSVVVEGGPQTLTGVTFQKVPTFPVGAITADQALTGATFAKAPTFPTGALMTTYALVGVTFARAPTFPQGALVPDAIALTGVTFQRAPTFPLGIISQGVLGVPVDGPASSLGSGGNRATIGAGANGAAMSGANAAD